MTDSSTPPTTEHATAPGDERERVDGRYLYCLVHTDPTSSAGESIATTGIDDRPVNVIECDAVGAVVHTCPTVYDTEDLAQVEQWVLTHQQVVDAASEVFGTPLPLRFDTVLEGGDAGVEQWLWEYHDRILDELTRFAGTWEYRIHLFWDRSGFDDHIAQQDEQLQEVQQHHQQAESGKQFLLEKKYEKRRRELERERRADLADTLKRRISPVVSELSEQDATTVVREETSEEDTERVTRLAVLTDEDNETALGNRLDEIAEQEAVEIRFTGPWPPYTFAPDVG